MRPLIRLAGGVASAIAIGALLTVAAWSAEVTFDCPATDGRGSVGLRYSDETLSVTDTAGTAALPANLQGDVADMFGVAATGESEQMVPDPAAMDACLSARLKATGGDAADDSVVAYALAGCQVDLAGSVVTQAVTLHVTATVIDPGSATVFIQRTYRTPSAVTGAALTLDEWPTRDCKVSAN